jgi:hypothetical protein
MVIVYLVWKEMGSKPKPPAEKRPRPKSSTGRPPAFRQRIDDDDMDDPMYQPDD